MDEIALTLFAAIGVVLVAMSVAFWFAGRQRTDQPYWTSWCVANAVLAAAMVAFIVEPRLAEPLVSILPNGLLVVGFAWRWRAARQFGGRATPPLVLWAPAAGFALCCLLPSALWDYQTTYTVVNVLLSAYALATMWEFWRDRADRLPSRYALAAAYLFMGASFGVRAGQGLLDSHAIGTHLPQDTLLLVHLWVGLVHTIASGAFALSIAYERGTAQLRYDATHDALTGLLNRGAFEAVIAERLADRSPEPFAVILFDIDHFKLINDRYGHAAGDEAIRACAKALREHLDASAIVARIGGEEFAALLPNCGEADAVGQAERVRRAVRALIVRAGDRHFRMTLSAGLCASDGEPRSYDEMMRVADARLYAAKEAGRDRVAVARTAA